jgi:hypothetical protein
LTGRTLLIPPEIVAKLVIITVQNEISTALVTKSRKELQKGERVKSDIFEFPFGEIMRGYPVPFLP